MKSYPLSIVFLLTIIFSFIFPIKVTNALNALEEDLIELIKYK